MTSRLTADELAAAAADLNQRSGHSDPITDPTVLDKVAAVIRSGHLTKTAPAGTLPPGTAGAGASDVPPPSLAPPISARSETAPGPTTGPSDTALLPGDVAVGGVEPTAPTTPVGAQP